MKSFFWLLLFFLTPKLTFATDLTMNDFIKSAWREYPLIKSEAWQSQEDQELIKSGQGKYLPHFSVDAISTQGFPASSSSLHESGIVGSPFRSGPAVDLVAEQLISDFGRTETLLKRMKADSQLEAAQESHEKMTFLMMTSALYLNCAKMRTEIEDNSKLIKWTKLIADETRKMMVTGQKTVVDRSLSEVELSESQLNLVDLQEDRISLKSQIDLYAHRDDVDCQPLGENLLNGNWADFRTTVPSVLLAKAYSKISEASIEQIKANQHPILQMVGSYGYMDNSRLVPAQNYSVGIGLIFPLFDGGEDYHKQKAAEIKSQVMNENVNRSVLDFRSYMLRLDSDITRLQKTISGLDQEQVLIEKTLRLAVDRYLKYNGQLVDAREAFRKFKDVQARRTDLLIKLLEKRFAKQIFDTSL